ncbi:MAG: mannitol dehydrogenase family protein [Maricaulaceae bacterium]
MSRLSSKNLPENIQSFSYNRDAVDMGIVHFGIGNFHRAHQAVYVEQLLEKGATQWGITGVSLRSASMQKALTPQDYIYTLAILGEQTEYRAIGAIKNVLVAPHNPEAVINLIADEKTQLISSTITEKGYYLSSGKVDFEGAALKAEQLLLESPTTIYGFLAQGLIARHQQAPEAKLTIMCCDNISKGGELLESGVHHLLRRHDVDTLEWAQSHVSFISSMVDRVSPATNEELIDSVLRETGREDASPVSAEPFSQWIIEDNFAGERPAFDQVGAVFVKDITPFERMKLSYLNAAHTMTSTLGYLWGTTYVHEALEEEDVFAFVRQALYENVLVNAEVPAGYDGADYIEGVIKRFQNANLPYANLQVGTDSSQKIQQRWFPTIDVALSRKNDTSYFAFCLAAWAVFIETALKNGTLKDPNKSAFEQVKTHDIGEWVLSYLKISNANQYDFYDQSGFILPVIDYVRDIKNKGVKPSLKRFQMQI